MNEERADCNTFSPHLKQLGEYLDKYLRFEHGDAMTHVDQWRTSLDITLPEQGIGIDRVIK